MPASAHVHILGAPSIGGGQIGVNLARLDQRAAADADRSDLACRNEALDGADADPHLGSGLVEGAEIVSLSHLAQLLRQKVPFLRRPAVRLSRLAQHGEDTTLIGCRLAAVTF